VLRLINKDVLFPLNGWLSRNINDKRSVSLSLGLLARELLMVLTCFLMGRAVLFQQIAPFGIGIFAVLLSKKKGGLTAFLAVTAGAISFRLASGGFLQHHVRVTILAMLLFVIIWNLFGKKSTNWSVFRTAVSVSSCILLVNTAFLLLYGFLMYEMLVGLFESVVGFVTVYIFSLSVDVLWDVKKRQILSGEEMICLCIFLSLLIIGFWEVQIQARAYTFKNYVSFS
jgi:stage II sporulation protein E